MDRKKEGIDAILNPYLDFCRDIKSDSIEALKEGAEEGIKEGTKSGILGGLYDCFGIRFLKMADVNVKDLDEIFKNVADDTLKEQAKNTFKNELCPKINNKLQAICDRNLEKIKEEKIKIDADTLDLIENETIRTIAKEKIEAFESDMKQTLPQNFVFDFLFDAMQKAICECVIENFNACEKKLQDALQQQTSG